MFNIFREIILIPSECPFSRSTSIISTILLPQWAPLPSNQIRPRGFSFHLPPPSSTSTRSFLCVCGGGGGGAGGRQGSLLLNPQRFDVIMPAPPAPSVGILRHPQPIPARKSELSSYPAQLNQINQKEEEEEEGKGDGNRNQLLRGEHVAIDVQISSRGSCDMQMSLCSCCSVQECCALMKNNKRRPCPLFAGFPSSSPWSLLPPPSHSSLCQESWEDGAGMLCPEILTGDSGARLTPSEPRPMAADRPRERGPAAGLRPAAFTFYLISLGINLIDINHLNRAPRPPRSSSTITFPPHPPPPPIIQLPMDELNFQVLRFASWLCKCRRRVSLRQSIGYNFSSSSPSSSSFSSFKPVTAR